jgi:hypothetical protein
MGCVERNLCERNVSTFQQKKEGGPPTLVHVGVRAGVRAMWGYDVVEDGDDGVGVNELEHRGGVGEVQSSADEANEDGKILPNQDRQTFVLKKRESEVD